jgi:hypothetical protein
MFLDHPDGTAIVTVTDSRAEPDRIERLERAHGDALALALADVDGRREFVGKLNGIHDREGRLVVFRHAAPTGAGQACRTRAWASKVGDGTTAVVHEF